MLDMQIIASGRAVPLIDLPAMFGRRRAVQELGDQIEALLAFMDDLDGDPDLEDSEAGMSAIDKSGRLISAVDVCPQQDEDREPDECASDIGYTEWQSRGSHKTDMFGAEIIGRDRNGGFLAEDAEDDDPGGGDVVDEPHDAEEDRGAEESGEAGSWPEQIRQATGGEHYPDDGGEDDAAFIRKPHRDYIRKAKCLVTTRWGYSEYRLTGGRDV